VTLDQLPLRFGSINHRNFFESPMMPLTATNSRDDAEEDAVFAGSIDCNPYDAAIRLRVPDVNIQVGAGHWILGLNPQGLADARSKLRAQADLLREEVLPALIAACEDRSAHHPEHPLTTSALPPGLTQAEATQALTPINPRAAEMPARCRTRPSGLHQEPEAVTWTCEKACLTKQALANVIGISEQLDRVLCGEADEPL
jgi:hypothetical protein